MIRLVAISEQSLEEACLDKRVRWSRLIVGDDYRDDMVRLVRDLTVHDPSPTGDGRHISCGHAYWGVGPTIAWHNACTDPSYPVGRLSMEGFADMWRALRPSNGDALPDTYVSLGPGTGEKDLTVLASLADTVGGPSYIPVDMSAEMLRLQLSARGATAASLRRMVAIKLDFSIAANIRKLRVFLDRIVGDDTPILFSLLGNTLANFPEDQKLLNALVEGLLIHDSDRLLLEVATSSRLDESAADKAAKEYRGSALFLDWVTSALLAHTRDLVLGKNAVKFLPSVEKDRALVLKVVYANTSTDEKDICIANGESFSFPPEDTIRLELTRKYHPNAVTTLLSDASLVECGRASAALADDDDTDDFGLALVLARRDKSAKPSDGPRVRIFKRSDG
jgi:L-histidine N-alpha-methyltransferase